MSKNRKRIAAAEQDIEMLLLRFTKLVQLGAELSFATFKRIWVDLHFSYIFMGNHTGHKHEHFIQCLYASALDGLDIPLWQLTGKPDTASVPNTATQPAEASGAQTSHNPPTQETSISYQDIRQIMLSDESDESDAANICRRPHNVVLERILQLEQQQQQQQQQVHPNGTALADTEKGITSSVSDPLADLQPVLEGETAVQPVTCSAGASVQAAQQAPQHQSRIAVCAATGSRNAARASQSQQHTRALRVFRDPFELAAINLSAPATNPSRPPRHPFAPAANPSGRPPNPQIHSDPTGVPFATKVGSLFTLYCLFEAQPIAPSGKVPIYLPLQLLLQLLPFLKEAQEKSVHDVGQVMMQLMKKNAFVVGAVRRPVRGSKAAEAAAQPPCRLAASSLQGDTGGKSRVEREAKYHMLSTLRGLTLVDCLHGMCQDYKAAKSSCFAALSGPNTKPPQGISKTTLGVKLGQLLSDATKAVDSKLYPPKREQRQKRKRGSQDNPEDEPVDEAADKAPGSDAELDSILENSMAALADEDEEDGEIVDELAGLEDEDCFASGLAGIRGKAARAVIQRDMRRKQQARSAELAWQRYETHVLQQPPGAFDPNPLDEPAPSNKDDSDFGPEADEWEGFHHGLHPEGPLDDSDKSENEPDDSDDMQDKGGTEPSLAMSCSKSSQHKTAKPLPRDRASARHRLSSLAADPSVSRRGPRPVPLKTVVRGKRRPKRKQTSALELHSNPASPTALCTTDTSSASDADDRQTGPASSLTQHLPKTAIGSQVAQVVSPNRNTSKSVRKQKSDKPPKPNKRQSKSKSHDAIQSQQQQQQQQQPASDHRDILDDLDSDMDDPAGSAGPCAEAQKYWAAAAEISSFLDEISD